ncbi:hypothetical protein BH11PSE2_BH11PSE2_13750 [soil metagenome]
MIRRAALISALALGLAVPALPQAQPAPPAPAVEPDLKLSLTYDGKILIKVLDLSLKQDIRPTSYDTAVRLKSYGILSAFKKLDQRASASGTVSGANLKPGLFTQQNFDGRKNRKVVARWTGSDVIAVATPDFPNWGDPPATKAQKVVGADPLTQIARIAMAPTAQGPCNGDTRFFDGKYLYKIDFTSPQAVKLPERARKLNLTNGVHCQVTFQEMAGFKAKPADKRNQGLDRPISVDFAQVGAGGPWVIFQIRAGTPLGDAVIDLTSVEMNGTRPA